MWLARTLVLIGALNWGLIGLFRFDLVAFLFGGPYTFLSRTVYSLVGLAAVGMLIGLFAAPGARTRQGERT